MGTTGELIRLMNYVEDITTTLRRISAFVPTLEVEERLLQLRVDDVAVRDDAFRSP